MLLIPYESLEKHELSECLFRLTQCPECSKEMFYNELENHQSNDCSPKQLTCLKCNSVYYRKDGHETIDCLKKQKEKIHEIAHSCDIKDSTRISRCCQKIVELYKRQESNRNYAQRNRSHGEEHDCKQRRFTRYKTIVFQIRDAICSGLRTFITCAPSGNIAECC